MASMNKVAQTLKALHVPGKPLILANVYDILSARAVAPLDSAKGLATTSYAVGRAQDVADDDVTLEMTFKSAEDIGKVAREFNKPLTVDLQDGYGKDLEKAITGVIERGAVGCNLEDYDNQTKKVMPVDEAEQRVKRAVEAAKKAGVPDFVINARCDTLVHGGELDEVLERGKRYLAAGASNIFVWGAGRGVSKDEVVRMVEAFGGRLNVMKKPGGLNVSELAQIGVARISLGPQLQLAAMKHLSEAADKLLSGEN